CGGFERGARRRLGRRLDDRDAEAKRLELGDHLKAEAIVGLGDDGNRRGSRVGSARSRREQSSRHEQRSTEERRADADHGACGEPPSAVATPSRTSTLLAYAACEPLGYAAR